VKIFHYLTLIRRENGTSKESLTMCCKDQRREEVQKQRIGKIQKLRNSQGKIKDNQD